MLFSCLEKSGLFKSTQQLKNVDKLLKLDPGNTELLAQKQKLLPVTAVVTGMGAASLKTTADFESSMSQVQATMGITKDSIVFTYLDYVLCRDNQSEFKDFQFQFRTSIEHFFPQHPINGENAVDEKNRDSVGKLSSGIRNRI